MNYLLIKTKLNNNGVNMPKPIQFTKLLLLILLFTSSTNVSSTHVESHEHIKAHIGDKWDDNRYNFDSEKNTVTDKVTALMWKRCPESLSGSDCAGVPERYTWKVALENAKTSEFAGYEDWRLPNVKELMSLVSRNRYAPAINSARFPNTPGTVTSSGFWSSSPTSRSSINSWQVSFYQGIHQGRHRTANPSYVRLVRDVK
jgi:hypothetical protein